MNITSKNKKSAVCVTFITLRKLATGWTIEEEK
jgi:hypothetical protein